MKELQNHATISLATRILDHEAYESKIQQIFQRVKEATMSFFVRTMISSMVMCIQIGHSQFAMAISIQQTASEIREDIKVST